MTARQPSGNLAHLGGRDVSSPWVARPNGEQTMVSLHDQAE